MRHVTLPRDIKLKKKNIPVRNLNNNSQFNGRNFTIQKIKFLDFEFSNSMLSLRFQSMATLKLNTIRVQLIWTFGVRRSRIVEIEHYFSRLSYQCYRNFFLVEITIGKFLSDTRSDVQ